MDRYLVLVMSNPVEGRDAEFHDWYENTHLDEVLSTCGWKSAERFALSAERGAACGFTHLAVYEAEADDAGSLVETLNATRDQRQQSEAIDLRNAGLWIFSPAGRRHYHPEHT
jgi:hypothetical protein